jgi:site-specific DNA recombinase
MEITIHPNLPDLYRRKVAKLKQALQHEATRPQVIETIRSLVDRIEVTPGLERGHCQVTIVGALAQILAFSQKKRPPPPGETAVRSLADLWKRC